MNKNTSINWPGLTHTWNPVRGCFRGCCKATHGFDCYARIMHNRFNKTPFDKIQVLEDKFYIPPSKKPRKIFVGSMSDICYWPEHAINNLLTVINCNISDTFMLLTKHPKFYTEYEWPNNVMCGTTITFFEGPQIEKIALASLANHPFLSVEPLLGCVPRFDYSIFEVVIVGQDNTRGAKQPKPEWIVSVKANIPPNKIWWKQAEIQPTYKQ